jgi:hypothetical protein
MLEIGGLEEWHEKSAQFASEAALELIQAGILTFSDRAELECQRNASDLVDSILNSLPHNGILHEIHTNQIVSEPTFCPTSAWP